MADYTRAFCHACPLGTDLFIGRDLRPSSLDLARRIVDAARAEGIDVKNAVPFLRLLWPSKR